MLTCSTEAVPRSWTETYSLSAAAGSSFVASSGCPYRVVVRVIVKLQRHRFRFGTDCGSVNVDHAVVAVVCDVRFEQVGVSRMRLERMDASPRAEHARLDEIEIANVRSDFEHRHSPLNIGCKVVQRVDEDVRRVLFMGTVGE